MVLQNRELQTNYGVNVLSYILFLRILMSQSKMKTSTRKIVNPRKLLPYRR